MNEFEQLGKKKTTLRFQRREPKEVMLRGLRYYCGEDALWLPEYNQVADWLSDNGGRGLLLFGANGRGKTVIAARILPVVFEYHLHVKHYVAKSIQLADVFRDKYERGLLTYRPVVVIDDFGAESVASEYGQRRDLFSEAVDNAESNSQLFIATTNLLPQEIKQRYGARTLDRLHGITTSVCFAGESLRRR